MKTNLNVSIVGGLLLAFLGISTPVQAAVTVIKIYDGDTVTLSTGERVRLLQIDTPELSPAECFADEARITLTKLLAGPGAIILKVDPGLDKVDKYGRLLRYIFKGSTNVNLRMVELGAAAPYFYRSERGMFSDKILLAAQVAQKKSLGLWRACPGTALKPNNAVETKVEMKVAALPAKSEGCDPNYAGCIPLSSTDLDCIDIKRLGLAPVSVIGTDVHKLDRDGDGVGCDK